MSVYDISNPAIRLPDALILDANILLRLRARSRISHPVQAFLNRIQVETNADRLLCFAPLTVFEECCKKIIQFGYETTRTPGVRGTWVDAYKKNPQHLRTILPDLAEFYETLRGFPIDILEPEDLGQGPPDIASLLLTQIELALALPKDAHLLAVAQRVGIPYIASLDRDFIRASTQGFHIYTLQ